MKAILQPYSNSYFSPWTHHSLSLPMTTFTCAFLELGITKNQNRIDIYTQEDPNQQKKKPHYFLSKMVSCHHEEKNFYDKYIFSQGRQYGFMSSRREEHKMRSEIHGFLTVVRIGNFSLESDMICHYPFGFVQLYTIFSQGLC